MDSKSEAQPSDDPQAALEPDLSGLSSAEAARRLQETGTLTENHLVLAEVQPFAPYRAGDVVRLAAIASDEATQDPLDLAAHRLAGGYPADRLHGQPGAADGPIPLGLIAGLLLVILLYLSLLDFIKVPVFHHLHLR